MSKEKYLNMQKSEMNRRGSNWRLDRRDPVVGVYDKHNAWKDWDEFLFKDIDTKGKRALEYGAGPGRNIIKFSKRFDHITGVDIAEVLEDKTDLNCAAFSVKNYDYKITTGDNVKMIGDDTIDVAFSCICLQHICCHSIRYKIMEDLFRVIKPGGHFCFQMGYGGKETNDRINGKVKWAKYFESYTDVSQTNGFMDVSIENVEDLVGDLEKIGYTNINYDIRPVGPGDNHRNWIFVRAEK